MSYFQQCLFDEHYVLGKALRLPELDSHNKNIFSLTDATSSALLITRREMLLEIVLFIELGLMLKARCRKSESSHLIREFGLVSISIASVNNMVPFHKKCCTTFSH
jgi:hypothetical protein